VSDTLISAFLSLVAIAVLGPIANHFITRYRERRSVHASLWVNESPLPILLKTYLQELQYKRIDPTSPNHPFTSGQLGALLFVEGYMRLMLHNPTKKKLNSITVSWTSDLITPLYQIDHESELHGPAEKKVLLGDLQPRQTRTLHIWTSFAFVDWHYTRLPILFEVTADEFDKLTLKFPFPGYLKNLALMRVSWYIVLVSMVLNVIVWGPDLFRWLRR
jgi:hypothetical protein